MNELELIRQRLNKVDEEILELLAERKSMVQEVTEYKAKNNLPAYQPGREVEMLARLRAIGETKGLDPAHIEKLFKLIIENSKQMQGRILDKVA